MKLLDKIMKYESSPDYTGEVDYSREVATAEKMYAEAEGRLAEILGVEVERLREVNPRLISHLSSDMVKWGTQFKHYSVEQQRANGEIE